MNKELLNILSKQSQVITRTQFNIAAAEYQASKMLSKLVIRKFTPEERNKYDNLNKLQEINIKQWHDTVKEHLDTMEELDESEKHAIETQGLAKYLKKHYNFNIQPFEVEDQIKLAIATFGEPITFAMLDKEGYMGNDVLFGERRKQRDEKLAQIEANFA